MRWERLWREGIKILSLDMFFEKPIRNLSEHVDIFGYISLELERLI